MGKTRTINLERRAEIGAERRQRTRTAILTAGFEVLGAPKGRAARVEDICSAAKIARGTFYYHFPSMEAFLEALSFELIKRHDSAVHKAFEILTGPIECTGAAIRYYLRAVAQDPKWGWAVVNSSLGRSLFGAEVSREVANTIRKGIEAGVFDVPSPEIGRDLLLGASLAAMNSILNDGRSQDLPEIMAEHILMSLGVSRPHAAELARVPLPDLRTAEVDSPLLPRPAAELASLPRESGLA